MMAEDTCKTQIAELEKKYGPKTKFHTCDVLPAVVKWLYETGGGNINLSAENHFL